MFESPAGEKLPCQSDQYVHDPTRSHASLTPAGAGLHALRRGQPSGGGRTRLSLRLGFAAAETPTPSRSPAQPAAARPDRLAGAGLAAGDRDCRGVLRVSVFQVSVSLEVSLRLARVHHSDGRGPRRCNRDHRTVASPSWPAARRAQSQPGPAHWPGQPEPPGLDDASH